MYKEIAFETMTIKNSVKSNSKEKNDVIFNNGTLAAELKISLKNEAGIEVYQLTI